MNSSSFHFGLIATALVAVSTQLQAQVYIPQLGAPSQVVDSVEVEGPARVENPARVAGGTHWAEKTSGPIPMGKPGHGYYTHVPVPAGVEYGNFSDTNDYLIISSPEYLEQPTHYFNFGNQYVHRPVYHPLKKRVFGFGTGLYGRNYESGRLLSASATRSLRTTDAEHDVFGSLEFYVLGRQRNGYGFELRFLGVFPGSESTRTSRAGATTELAPLDTLFKTVTVNGNTVVGPSVATLFNSSERHQLRRDSRVHSVELSATRDSRVMPRLSMLGIPMEASIGLRYFSFDESLQYRAINPAVTDIDFDSLDNVDHVTSVLNQLLGVQVGARSEYTIGERLALHADLRVGLYANRVNSRHRVDYYGDPVNDTGIISQASPQWFRRRRPDVEPAFLGELDLGLVFQFNKCWRCRFGYRTLGVAAVALAAEQLEGDFTDESRRHARVNGDLLLNGGYFSCELLY